MKQSQTLQTLLLQLANQSEMVRRKPKDDYRCSEGA